MAIYMMHMCNFHVSMLNDVMVDHVTPRCALIRICRLLLCYGASEVSWFVFTCVCCRLLYVCIHSSSALRLRGPRSVCMVSSPCERVVSRWDSEHHQWLLLDGIGECSPSLAVSGLCIIQALVHVCATKLASTFLQVYP